MNALWAKSWPEPVITDRSYALGWQQDLARTCSEKKNKHLLKTKFLPKKPEWHRKRHFVCIILHFFPFCLCCFLFFAIQSDWGVKHVHVIHINNLKLTIVCGFQPCVKRICTSETLYWKTLCVKWLKCLSCAKKGCGGYWSFPWWMIVFLWTLYVQLLQHIFNITTCTACVHVWLVWYYERLG